MSIRHRNFPSVFGLIVPLLLGALLVACSPETEPEPTSKGNDDREAVLALVDTLSTSVIVEAFQQFEEKAHARYVRTEQWGDGPRVIRTAETITHYRAGGEVADTVELERSGAFDDGGMPGILGSGERPLRNLPSFILPDEPAFAEPRYAEAFRYTVLPDTLWHGHTLNVVEVEAREDTGDDQSLRRVRYSVDADTGELKKLLLQRRDDGLLFGEHTTIEISLRPHGDLWVPALIRAHTSVGTLFREPQVFRTVISLFDFDGETSAAPADETET